MIFAQLSGCSSLREAITCLRALGSRRYHCGIRSLPARSTLAEANQRRDYRIFRDMALSFIDQTRPLLAGDDELKQLGISAYAIDSTTIDLCLRLFPWAQFRRHKAAVKAHTMLDLQAGLPVFMRITHAKSNDVLALDHICLQAGAFYVMDKGYTDFKRFYQIHQAGAFFISRARRGMVYRVTSRLDVPAGGPVKHDQLIRMRGPLTRQLYPDTLRRVRYIDPQSGKKLTFITNHQTLDALSVAMLYRKRWQIELLFKWMKQHLRIKAFFGTTPNAVKIQLWVAVLVYALIHRLKQQWNLMQTPSEIAQILSLMLLEKTPINQAFSDIGLQTPKEENPNQLSLFKI
jgi:hypothetical protein